jgi:hypothetical protein
MQTGVEMAAGPLSKVGEGDGWDFGGWWEIQIQNRG